MRLSLLDTKTPAHLPELIPELERLGYYRYWATEHHSRAQSASPVIIAGLAAGLSDRLRVGTAGVLLRATSALRVAEDFATLEMFFPGRIDLGIAGGHPGAAYAEELRRDLTLADNAAYRDRVSRLVEISRRAALPDGTSIGPQGTSRPQIWLCGTSAGAAALAGSLGINFAFHHYLASSDQRPIAGVAEAYRSAFASRDGSAPCLLIAAYGHCASTSALAQSEWESYFGISVPHPSFVGTPSQAAAQLRQLAEWYTADEVAVDCFPPSLSRRLEALADLKAAVDGVADDTLIRREAPLCRAASPA